MEIHRDDQSRLSKTVRRKRGVSAILVLFCVSALLIFGIVALNICWVNDCREKLQSTADSAAINGARALLVTEDANIATNITIENASHYRINNQPQVLKSGDIQFGTRIRNEDGSYTFVLDGKPLNSVRVTARRDTKSSASIPVFLGKLVGRENVDVAYSATATFADHDIAIVIDASGMMHGPGRFDGVKMVMEEMLALAVKNGQRLRFSITVFSKDAEMVLPLTKDLPSVKDAFDQVVLRGPRELGGGMHVGMESLFDPQTMRVDTKKSLLVLTECRSPRGLDPLTVADVAKQNDIDLRIFTFTKTAGTRLADQIAETSGGKHYHGLNRLEIREAIKQLIRDVPTFLFE